MPRYHFELHECGTHVPDEEGRELESLDEVREVAIAAARGVMSHEVQDGRLCLGCCIEVTDSAGAVVLSLPFREAITVSGI